MMKCLVFGIKQLNLIYACNLWDKFTFVCLRKPPIFHNMCVSHWSGHGIGFLSDYSYRKTMVLQTRYNKKLRCLLDNSLEASVSYNSKILIKGLLGKNTWRKSLTETCISKWLLYQPSYITPYMHIHYL